MKKWQILNESNQKTPEGIIDALLINRDVSKKEQETFLHPEKILLTAENVGLDEAVIEKSIKKIDEIISQGKTIIIYGDYDVDGITGTAILWETIYGRYKKVMPYIPHRFDEGYGISQKGIDNIIEKYDNVGLIITVDNGIVANDPIQYAEDKGIEVIITDHHTKGEILPQAYAIVHTTKICGSAVAFFLANAFERKKYSPHDEKLDLVALATVADLVPLTGANRTLLVNGLEILKKTKRVGLLSLFADVGIVPSKINVYEIGHMIGPRINASGRIEHGLESLRLLCTKDRKKSMEISKRLNEVNRQRQLMTEESILHSKKSLHITEKSKIIISHSTTYNQGVVGLIASRLVEEYYRPTLVIAVDKDLAKGSARSVSGVNIIELIRQSSEYLLEAGGHPMAAGFSLKTEHLQLFIEDVIQKASDRIEDKYLTRQLKIDLKISFAQISEEMYTLIQKLSPFGMGNPEPVFLSEKVTIKDLKVVGKDKKHIQFLFEQDGVPFKGIGFNMAENFNNRIGDFVDLVYSTDINEWNGNKSLQLKIKDLATSK